MAQNAPNYSRYRYRRRHRFPALLIVPIVIVIAVCTALLLSFITSRLNVPDDSQPSVQANAPIQTDVQSPSPTQSTAQVQIPWYLTLVNATHPLPDGFTVSTSSLTNGKEFDTRAFDALTAMLDDCKAAGLEPLVCSAYRSYEVQERLFQEQVERYMADGMSHSEAYDATATEIAIPNTSEHTLGLAADICALSQQVLDDAQANTPEQQWLMAHCAEYGFILRYPKGKENITGIIYEPWHYRYVGVDAAKEITEQELCLEEYMEQHYQLK